MTIMSRLIAKMFGLPGTETHAVIVDRDLTVPMEDGTILLAAHWYPRGPAGEPLPVIRTPYGRKESELVARQFAERGYQVVVQSARAPSARAEIGNPSAMSRPMGRPPWRGLPASHGSVDASLH